VGGTVLSGFFPLEGKFGVCGVGFVERKEDAFSSRVCYGRIISLSCASFFGSLKLDSVLSRRVWEQEWSKESHNLKLMDYVARVPQRQTLDFLDIGPTLRTEYHYSNDNRVEEHWFRALVHLHASWTQQWPFSIKAHFSAPSAQKH
jgi:hypothetical protein